MEQNENKNRFVCPNDRQLTLRAKLKTGWSVKTGSLGYHGEQKEPNLDAEEQKTIIQVIKRAEVLELKEQERIGRLVDRLENMRRYAIGRSPSQCLLCGDNFGLLGAQSVLCMACHKLVCQKCAIEAYDICKKNSTHSKDQWMCKICAETREMWKKSGAWFFKSIPKYVLPGQANKNKLMQSPAKPKDDDSSSEEDKPTSMMRIEKKSPAVDSIVHEASQSQVVDTFSRQTSSTDSQKSVGALTLSDPQEKWDAESVTHPESSSASRRESVASRSLSEWGWSDDKVFSMSTSAAGSIASFKTMQCEEPRTIDPGLGSIELTLSYDSITDTLHCTVHRAKNLLPMDINGLADPFCKLNIFPEGKLSTRLRTKTVHKTRNPEFNESLTFYEISESDLQKKSLHILVMDDDRYGYDYMGESKVNLVALRAQKSIHMTLMLEKHLNSDSAERSLWFEDLWSRGQILISLCYNTKRRALLVTVVKCQNLLPMDNNGYSDPFVKLQLRPDSHHRKYKTSIKWKNLNPYFNEEFPFDTRPNEMSCQSLYITVWDKDYGKSNDYLGGLIIGGLGSKGQRLKHWLDMIRYPDHRHEHWHNLTEDPLPD